jgi:hypothetical protein
LIRSSRFLPTTPHRKQATSFRCRVFDAAPEASDGRILDRMALHVGGTSARPSRSETPLSNGIRLRYWVVLEYWHGRRLVRERRSRHEDKEQHNERAVFKYREFPRKIICR